MTTNSTTPAQLCSLNDPRVSAVIDRLAKLQSEINPSAGEAIFNDLAVRTAPYSHREIVDLFAPGSFACPPQTARSLYSLVRAMRPTVVLEFGTAHGFSAVHVAAALRDNGAGRLYTAEMHPEKVLSARANLDEAGLTQWAEVMEGDATDTLGAVPDVDMLYLDGWVDHYLEVLQAVEGNLKPGAFIQADDTGLDWSRSRKGTKAYVAYITDSSNGYSSVPFTDYQGYVQSCFLGHAR